MRQPTQRTECRQDRPCAVCGATRGCSVGADALIFCRGKQGPQEGFSHHGQAERDPQWSLYRPLPGHFPGHAVNDPPPHAKIKGRKGNGGEIQAGLPWLRMAEEFAGDLTSDRKTTLSLSLGLPVYALDAIQLLGFSRDSRMGNVWTFPELDGAGHVVGINRRTANGKQQVFARARRGLSVCRWWEETNSPVYIVEGASDVMALAALGLVGIGRPSCRAGVDDLVQLLQELSPTRRIVVLGEWDVKDDGSWPGKDAAVWVAQQLAARLGRDVQWSLPPDRKKDVRAWGVLHPTPSEDEVYWRGMGARFEAGLRLQTIVGGKGQHEGPGLQLRAFSSIDPAVLHWAVPGYFPQGELVLLAGDGGEGKSLITLHMASRITRGDPCFGLNYGSGGPQNVLLACCEDDSATTTKPRLMAAGADMERVHEIQGVYDKEGRISPFGLGHIEQIANALKKLTNVGLIVIDPVTAYLGASGVDDGKDVEIRTLLEPLRVIVREAKTLCVLVKHFNKTISPKASARIAGAAGWRNAARASYLVLPDPTLPGRKLFLPDKLNGAPLPMGLMYRPALPSLPEMDRILKGLPDAWPAEDVQSFKSQLARTEWLGETDLDADSVCQEQSIAQVDANLDNDRAGHWLRRALGEGAMRGQDVVEDGNAALELQRDLRWWRDRILKGRLGGSSVKGRGANDGWYFCLPGQSPPGLSALPLEGVEESEESEES